MGSNITAGVGMSTHPTIRDAVDEAWSKAKSTLDGPPSMVVAYAGVAYNQPALLAEVRKQTGGVPVIGGSSQGISVSGNAFESHRFLALAAITGIKHRMARVDDIGQDSAKAGRELAAQLGTLPEGPYTALLFYDPLGGGNAQAILESLAEAGIQQVHGAATGQPWGGFVRTYQYAGDRVTERGATVTLIEGLRPVADLTHGAESIGLELTVTRAEHNTVFELDGQPALDTWCEQLGLEASAHVDNSANWALGIKPPESAPYEGLITRAPFALDHDQRALILQAPIAEGTIVQVCTRTIDAVFDGAKRMGERLREAIAGVKPVIALGFECGARPEPFLGATMAKQEICELQQAIGPDIPWIGTYAWGEIAPVGDTTHFHNFTFPLCILAP